MAAVSRRHGPARPVHHRAREEKANMRHYLYAVVENADMATRAIQALERTGTPSKHCSVLAHRDRLRDEELPVGETDFRDGALRGAAIGGALGAALGGVVLGPLGLAGAGTLFAGALAASTGAIDGAIFGGISAASTPEQALEDLRGELARGRVILSVETPDAACQREAERTLLAEGARVLHRARD
jgi:hypothetical protein